MWGRSLWLARHPYWLLHVWYLLVLWGQCTRRHLWQVDLSTRRHLWAQGGVNGLVSGGQIVLGHRGHVLTRGGHVVLRDWRKCLIRGGHWSSGTTWYLDRHVLLLGHQVLLGESLGHLLTRMGQVGLRCWLRGWGDLRLHLDLRRCRHHLRDVALWSLVALGDLRPRLVTILQLTWVRLLVLGRHVPMRVSLLSLRSREGSWTSLVPPRDWWELLLRLFG